MKCLEMIISMVLTVLLAPGLPAELVFEKTRIEVLAKPEQEEVAAIFKFTNQGTSEARIVSVSSGCQCLSAKASAEVIPAQGSSEITGVFKVGNSPGITEKAIQVRVSEGGKSRSLALTVVVELKRLIIIEPQTMTWSGNEAATEQFFTVTMHGDELIRLQEVECSRPGFDIRVETVTDGKKYRVFVTPQEAASPTLGIFHFKTDCKHTRFATPIAFGHVKKN